MNSKELLEQANARATQISHLAIRIGQIEEVLPNIRDKVLYINGYDIGVRVGTNTAARVSQEILMLLIAAKNEKVTELEQLLGIHHVGEITVDTVNDEILQIGDQKPVPEKCKPATINPEFEAATKDMFDAVKKPDPVENKLTEILHEESKKIENSKSLSKYPAKKSKATFPDNMTKEAVSKMYIDEGMTAKQVAAHFGVSPSKANTFLQMHKLFRGSYNKASDKEPSETERP